MFIYLRHFLIYGDKLLSTYYYYSFKFNFFDDYSQYIKKKFTSSSDQFLSSSVIPHPSIKSVSINFFGNFCF